MQRNEKKTPKTNDFIFVSKIQTQNFMNKDRFFSVKECFLIDLNILNNRYLNKVLLNNY